MLSRGEFNAKANRRELPGADEASVACVAFALSNPDKALVMQHIGHLVADGFAEWSTRDNGDVEVCLSSGETYLLAETTILRFA